MVEMLVKTDVTRYLEFKAVMEVSLFPKEKSTKFLSTGTDSQISIDGYFGKA